MANITRYNPFEEFFKPFTVPADTELKMKIDVKEDDTFTVKADIPG